MKTSNKLIRFDWFIKKMLRDKSNFKVLEGFLSALLKKDIVILNILESEGNQDSDKSKFNRVDILVEDENKEKIIVEIQNERESDYLERILFGSSKVIVDYFKLGDKYKEISKVISVSILYFNLGLGNDYIYYGTTEFYGMHTKERLKVKNKIATIDEGGSEKITYEEKKNIFPEYYLINVEKFKDMVKEDIDEWIYMLKNSEIKREFKSKYIKEAELQLNLTKLDSEDRRAYEKHLEALAIERDIMTTAKEEGIEIGEDRRAIKIAVKMLGRGDITQDIIDVTELSEEKILELRNELGK
jgi:predicted transposase/invertase (TIGR01784 family)